MDKSTFFATNVPKITQHDIPGVGVIHIKELSGQAHDAITLAAQTLKGSAFEIALIKALVVDDTGNPMFTDEDDENLWKVRAPVLTAMAEAALRMVPSPAAAEISAVGE